MARFLPQTSSSISQPQAGVAAPSSSGDGRPMGLDPAPTPRAANGPQGLFRPQRLGIWRRESQGGSEPGGLSAGWSTRSIRRCRLASSNQGGWPRARGRRLQGGPGGGGGGGPPKGPPGRPGAHWPKLPAVGNRQGQPGPLAGPKGLGTTLQVAARAAPSQWRAKVDTRQRGALQLGRQPPVEVPR